MSLNAYGNNETITWFTEFIGVGYDYHDVHMNIFPLFEDKTHASSLWKKTFESLDGNQIKIRFVELGNNYWFNVYTVGSEANIGLLKNVPMSENYLRFKEGFVDKAILRFGTYKKNEEETEKNNKGRRHRFELLKKSKLVRDVKFMQYSELPVDSVERRLVENGKVGT
jgi:hypothetical protein